MYTPYRHSHTQGAPSPAITSAAASAAAVAVANAHANAGLNAIGLTAIVGAGLCVLFLAAMTAYTYWRIASGREVRPVRKERPWNWRYDPESGQLVPLEPVTVSSVSLWVRLFHAHITSPQWPTWSVDEASKPTCLRNPPPAPYNPLAEIDAKRTAPPPPPTIALSTSTSFHTIQSLEDLHAGIYDMIRGVQHEHVCSSDLRKPGPARRPAPTVVVVAPAEEEADLTELLHSPALFFAERRPVKVGHLAVPEVDHKGRLLYPKPHLESQHASCLAPLSRSTHNEAPPTLPLFTRTPSGPRRTSLPSSRRGRSSKENAPLISRI
jgi:hypothetical protein